MQHANIFRQLSHLLMQYYFVPYLFLVFLPNVFVLKSLQNIIECLYQTIWTLYLIKYVLNVLTYYCVSFDFTK